MNSILKVSPLVIISPPAATIAAGVSLRSLLPLAGTVLVLVGVAMGMVLWVGQRTADVSIGDEGIIVRGLFGKSVVEIARKDVVDVGGWPVLADETPYVLTPRGKVHIQGIYRGMDVVWQTLAQWAAENSVSLPGTM